LLGPIVALGAGAVQEQDYGILFVALVIVGHKDDVLGFSAVGAFVDLVEEAGFDRIAGTGLEKNQAGEGHERQAQAGKAAHCELLDKWAGLC